MPTWQKENNHDIILKLVLFLISPFFAFVYSLRTMRTRSSYVVYFLFAIFLEWRLLCRVVRLRVMEWMGQAIEHGLSMTR